MFSTPRSRLSTLEAGTAAISGGLVSVRPSRGANEPSGPRVRPADEAAILARATAFSASRDSILHGPSERLRSLRLRYRQARAAATMFPRTIFPHSRAAAPAAGSAGFLLSAGASHLPITPRPGRAAHTLASQRRQAPPPSESGAAPASASSCRKPISRPPPRRPRCPRRSRVAYRRDRVRSRHRRLSVHRYGGAPGIGHI